MKVTVNYDSGTAIRSPIDETVDVTSLDESRLKLSHHPSGFVQYSGDGVLSGRNPDGSIRGMGVMSSPLNNIFRGPCVTMIIQGIEELETIDGLPNDGILFDLDTIPPFPKSNALFIEVFYFVPNWRRFIRKSPDGHDIINIQHPNTANLQLRVMLSGETCRYPGFLGVEAYRSFSFFPESGFTLNGPSGNMRLNEHGQRIADGLFCMYPRLTEFAVRRSLNFPPPQTLTQEQVVDSEEPGNAEHFREMQSRIKSVFKVTYPNGKILVGKDLIGEFNHFGYIERSLLAKDFKPEQLNDITIRRQVLWESMDASDDDVNKKQIELILLHNANDPTVGYNEWPEFTSPTPVPSSPPPPPADSGAGCTDPSSPDSNARADVE